ncbi:MAG TPA: transferrin-binding protein-like solute binding protein [Micropepsaceae bacterium]|nr:transferrin-binding protein-like solute binding protein [Micropepsaceae bacterium]
MRLGGMAVAACFVLIALAVAACAGAGGNPPAAMITSPATVPATPSANSSPPGGGGPIEEFTPTSSPFTELQLPEGNFAILTVGGTPYDGPEDCPFLLTPPEPATAGTNATHSTSGMQPSTGEVYPFKQTVISVTGSYTVPDAAVNAGGASLSVVDWKASGESQFRLTIPGLGVDSTFTSASLLKGPSTVLGGTFQLVTFSFNYALLGMWQVDSIAHPIGCCTYLHDFGAFISGYETPASAIPAAGTAVYSATANVAGYLTAPFVLASLAGDGSFSADFSSGVITGNFTNMVASNRVTTAPWNDVSITASLISGTSHFSGSTAVTSAPDAAFAISRTASGHIDGGFYGPNANELGAVWSLSDSTSVAIGVVRGTH